MAPKQMENKKMQSYYTPDGRDVEIFDEQHY